MRPGSLVGASLAVAAAAWAVRGRSSQIFGPSVWRADSGRRSIALTFDDGPTPGTLRILDILAQYNAPATFFQCGVNVLRTPEITQAVAAGPHEIGNHSHTHPYFAFARSRQVLDEFSQAQEAISQTAGSVPVLMRAPYGVRWSGFREMQNALGLNGVMWSVIGRDWRLSAKDITDRVLGNVQPGGIVCLHDGRVTAPNPDIDNTIEAVRRIVPGLLDAGYHLETVSQLLCQI
jgi:peptidoglycan/xylan/chitin deacetylase (PgdA/CDA1 family)